jgi:hypothetical protein
MISDLMIADTIGATEIAVYPAPCVEANAGLDLGYVSDRCDHELIWLTGDGWHVVTCPTCQPSKSVF